MSHTAEFATSPFPKGWFIVGRADEVAAGVVKSLRYFGENLVLWRGESGTLFLQDAYCLHLGADRGVRGRVAGDELVCPWHGWQWDGEGRNTCIPYKNEQPKPALKIRTYPVREWYGTIICWYAPEGVEPDWDLPRIPELEGGDFYPIFPHGTHSWTLKGHVQLPIENAVDFAHIPHVHESPQTDVVSFETDRHRYTAVLEILYGAGKEATALTPDGPQKARFISMHEGIGITLVRWPEVLWPSVVISGFTAIDEHSFVYFVGMASKRGLGETGDEPQGMAKRMLKMHLRVAQQDFFAWENARPGRANFAQSELRDYPRLRYWATQFFPETSAAYVNPDKGSANVAAAAAAAAS